MIKAPAATSVIQYTDGAAPAVPTFDGSSEAVPSFDFADMVVGAQIPSPVLTSVPPLSLDASRGHADVQTSAGHEPIMGTHVPSSEDAAMVSYTHVATERMTKGSADSTSATTAMKHPSTLVVSAQDTRTSQAEVSNRILYCHIENLDVN
jgi:hypothetical protein